VCGCKIGPLSRKSNSKSVSATLDPDQQEDVKETTLLDQELQAMVRIAGTILRYADMDDILAAIAKEMSSIVRFDQASVAILSPDGQSLVLQRVPKGEGESERHGDARRIPLEESTAIGWVAFNKKPILRRDIANDGRFLEAVEEERLQSEVVVPLISREKLIGTLNVGSRTRNALTQKDLEVLVKCGNIACGAIEHALLLSEAEDIGELYKTCQQNASDIVMLIDINTGKLIETNRKCSEVLGFTDKELTAKSYFDLFPREEQLQARRDFINVLSRSPEQKSARREQKAEGSRPDENGISQ
jgi:PAS domain S-box-containing protein